jgi:RNA polymerase sigma-70 factor (ECF subfamily)
MADEGGRARDWMDVQTRLVAGDRLAFLELNRLVTGVLRQLRAYDFQDEWDDLRQEVAISVIQNARAGRLRDPEAFVGYVRIITRNKFVDRLKRRLRHREKESLPWDDESERLMRAPAGQVDGALSADIATALGELAPDERRAVEGVYAEGRTYQEVSDLTGIPLGTLKRRLRDGLRKLRQRLEGAHAEE